MTKYRAVDNSWIHSAGEGDYLFVYGTLRKDFFGPVWAILTQHSDFVGEATFRGKLYDLGDYPGAVPSDKPSDTVKGELHRLHDGDRVLRYLDQYEGCSASQTPPPEFRRQRAVVHLDSTGKKVSAWIYLYNRSQVGLRVIPSGDYLNFRKGRR